MVTLKARRVGDIQIVAQRAQLQKSKQQLTGKYLESQEWLVKYKTWLKGRRSEEEEQ